MSNLYIKTSDMKSTKNMRRCSDLGQLNDAINIRSCSEQSILADASCRNDGFKSTGSVKTLQVQ